MELHEEFSREVSIMLIIGAVRLSTQGGECDLRRCGHAELGRLQHECLSERTHWGPSTCTSIARVGVITEYPT